MHTVLRVLYYRGRIDVSIHGRGQPECGGVYWSGVWSGVWSGDGVRGGDAATTGSVTCTFGTSSAVATCTYVYNRHTHIQSFSSLRRNMPISVTLRCAIAFCPSENTGNIWPPHNLGWQSHASTLHMHVHVGEAEEKAKHASHLCTCTHACTNIHAYTCIWSCVCTCVFCLLLLN